jgi:hypothetical protein
VADPESGRDDAQALERAHGPLQELVTLPVTLQLDLHVERERAVVAEVVDLHRMIDHEVDRHPRDDPQRLIASACHS